MPEQILLVDDDQRLVNALAIRLSAVGYAVQTARDGFEGISTAALIRPDVIVLDVQMPVMDGYEVCQLIRTVPELRAIPILVLSANVERFTNRAILESGGNVILRKPYQWEHLLGVLREVLNRRYLSGDRSCPATVGQDCPPSGGLHDG